MQCNISLHAYACESKIMYSFLFCILETNSLMMIILNDNKINVIMIMNSAGPIPFTKGELVV